MHNQSNSKKLIFIYDYLDSLGGAEYVLDRLQQNGKFITIVGYKNKFLKDYFQNFEQIKPLFNLKATTFNRFIVLPLKFIFYFKNHLKEEKIIFSGQFALFGALFRDKRLNYLYSHSLPKFCYYDDIYKNNNFIISTLIFVYRLIYNILYKKILFTKIHKHIVNSEYTSHEFISKIEHNKNTVLEPIFNEKVDFKYKNIPTNGYFICSDRYHKSKNVNYLIEEFKTNKLKIVFTNIVPPKIKNNLKEYKNFIFYENLMLPQYLSLVLNSKGLISLAENEDFGLNVNYALMLNKNVLTLNSGYFKYLEHKLLIKLNNFHQLNENLLKIFHTRSNKIIFENLTLKKRKSLSLTLFAYASKN